MSIPTNPGGWRSASSGAAVAGYVSVVFAWLTVSRHAVAIGVGRFRCKRLGVGRYGIALLRSLFRCVRAVKLDRAVGWVSNRRVPVMYDNRLTFTGMPVTARGVCCQIVRLKALERRDRSRCRVA